MTPIPGTSGEMRFYVIQLSDHSYATGSTASSSSPGRFTWWHGTKSDGIEDSDGLTSTAFGSGWSNTLTMKELWNNETYGEQNASSTLDDVWSIDELAAEDVYITNTETREATDSQWFIPSSGELGAFLGLTGVDSTNYDDYGLASNDGYATSSLASSTTVYSLNPHSKNYTSSTNYIWYYHYTTSDGSVDQYRGADYVRLVAMF